jgi:phage FluMu gp28-like protein
LRQAEIKDWCDEKLLPVLNKLNQQLMHAFGEDFGRLGDLTVIDPITIEQNLDRTVPFSVELRNIPFKQQEQVLFYIVDRLPRLIGRALDAGGNGMYLAEQARHRYGSGRIQEIKLSEGWYLENMPKFKAAFEDAKLTIPADADQLNDLRALQVINGIIRLPKAKTEAGVNQRHGDSAISKALAYFSSLQGGAPIEFESTGIPRVFGLITNHRDRFSGAIPRFLNQSDSGLIDAERGTVRGLNDFDGFDS